jgi:phytoene dehydrogenase-like protein
MPNKLECDVAVVGAGPNGLMTAAYMAKAGLKVILLERRGEIGGGLATEEVLYPCHYANTHAMYHLMVDYLPMMSDFNFSERGLLWIYPNAQTGMIFKDRRSLLLSRMQDCSYDSILRWSEEDANKFADWIRVINRMMDEILAPGTYVPPIPSLDLVVKTQKTKLGQQFLEMMEKSPYESVTETFKHPKVRALFLYIACMWGLDPTETGAFLFPLMIWISMRKRQCYGGSHKMASLFGKDIVTNGGLILENAEVVKINVENGQAAGVELFDGTVIKAKAVASTLDPQSTFLRLVGENKISPTLAERCKAWKYDKWSLWTMHIATERPLEYDVVDDPRMNESLMNIMGFENEDEVLKFFAGVRAGKLDHIGGHATCETLYDPTLVDIPGRHVSKFQFPAPYDLDGKKDNWEKKKKEVEHKVLDLWLSHLKGFTSKDIIAYSSESPVDIERRIPCMVKGAIKHGDYNILQMGYNRPDETCSTTRTPIAGLYVCGASTYPGGMVTGGPAYIASSAIAEDMGARKWWRTPAFISRYVETYLKD